MNQDFDLDFSGGPNSWFDFWHMHVDLDGKGNKDWNTRTKYLKQLITTYKRLKEHLASYPNSFQLWIMIDENDSENDCIYIHTRNPNADNFPIKVKADSQNTISDENLKQYIDALPFEKVRIKTSDGDIYYLFEKGTGISLV